jgi:hypothetical protein
MSSGGSCRQGYCFGSGRVTAAPDEFHEDCGFGGSCEKSREGIAEGDGDDLFGAGQSWPGGPNARAEESPDQLGCGRGEDLKEALGDEPSWMWRRQAAIFRRTAFGVPGRAPRPGIRFVVVGAENV